MTATERKSGFNITTDTPYLALRGELWGAYWEDLGENWPRLNGTAVYFKLKEYASDLYFTIIFYKSSF